MAKICPITQSKVVYLTCLECENKICEMEECIMATSNISEQKVAELRKIYPSGTRVRLVKMDDPYNKKLVSGSLGTVTHVDDIGSIHVHWDCGSSLAVIYGEDECEIVK